MTLVEAMVALVAAAVLGAAVAGATLTAQRFALAASARLASRRALRTAAGVLRAELEGAPRAAGALVRVGLDAVTLRATRAVAIVCGVDSTRGRVLLDDRRRWELRAPDPAKDSVLMAADTGDVVSTQWYWAAAGLAAVGRGTCPDGSAAAALTLSGGAAAVPPTTRAGAPLLVFETVEYRLYADGAGDWWLGTRSGSAGGWTATSPVAGPLRARDGLQLAGLDAQSRPAVVESVVAVRAVLRARRPVRGGGSATDLLELLVTVP
jgi:hypothetical protein